MTTTTTTTKPNSYLMPYPMNAGKLMLWISKILELSPEKSKTECNVDSDLKNRVKLRTGASMQHSWQNTHGWCVSHHTVVVCILLHTTWCARKVCTVEKSKYAHMATHPLVCGCNELIRKGRSWGHASQNWLSLIFQPIDDRNIVFWLSNQSQSSHFNDFSIILVTSDREGVTKKGLKIWSQDF